ncbi:MAG: SRPBCC domain-containing protein [Solirubrobacteraceae bacterium]
MDPLRLAFTVGCPPEHAFSTWAERTSLWWPKGHSVTGDPELSVTIEPRPGGRIFERTPTGDEHDWGEVVAWEPPCRLAYLWHLRQDRADATRVEVSFAAAEAGTEVTIVHSGWERLGARAQDLRERNVRGWAGLVPHFEAFVRLDQRAGSSR